jgi:hypothetical protein
MEMTLKPDPSSPRRRGPMDVLKRARKRQRPWAPTAAFSGGRLYAGVTALILLLASTAHAAQPVQFDWFEYTGRDAAFEAPLPEGHFRNPILAGFHSDPSVVAARGKFYMVHSTFTYFPGIPVFESEDLVHWTQVGSAIHRRDQLDFDGLGVSRGVFAPAIEYHDGTFYVVNTPRSTAAATSSSPRPIRPGRGRTRTGCRASAASTRRCSSTTTAGPTSSTTTSPRCRCATTGIARSGCRSSTSPR